MLNLIPGSSSYDLHQMHNTHISELTHSLCTTNVHKSSKLV